MRGAGHVLRGPLDPPPSPGDEGHYHTMRLPPLELEYSLPLTADEMKDLSVEDVREAPGLENVPAGVQGPFQWVDLLGEGLEGIFAHQGGNWSYTRNMSAINFPAKRTYESIIQGLASLRVEDVEFSPLETVENQPVLTSQGQSGLNFMSVAGDSCLDLVRMRGEVKGFYRSLVSSTIGPVNTSTAGWMPFRPFESSPTISLDEPNVRLVDLSGNGTADVLVTHDDVFVYYESLRELGFQTAVNESQGPRVLFSDPTNLIYLADMSRDGLVDIGSEMEAFAIGRI